MVLGELDLGSVGTFGRELHGALEHHERVVLDLSGLHFIDSSGIHAIVEADLHARVDDRRLEILRAPAGVHRVFELCRVAPLLPFAD